MDVNIIIYDSGLNGSKVFSIFEKIEKTPVITKKEIEKISIEMVRIYPDLCEKIHKANENFSEEFPIEIDLSMLEPGSRSELIEKISKGYAQSIKNK